MKRDETQVHPWNAADTITAVRMAASLILLIFPLRSAWFLAVYTLAGLTDALDGWLARKTGTASAFGARLDSIADLLFYGVLLLRLFPVLRQALPVSVWYVVTAVALVRMVAYAVAAVKYHRFASLHTWLNKLTGGQCSCCPMCWRFQLASHTVGSSAPWLLPRHWSNWRFTFVKGITVLTGNPSFRKKTET